jgi:hypothetical protein
MQYFDTLPKIIKTDPNGNSTLMVNLIARCSVIPDILKNPLVYYSYDIQEGDTPEIIAYKYYGDSYRYWIVLYVNQILDPQWQWPMQSSVLESFISDKYNFNARSTTHHYEKIITKVDLRTNTTTIDKYIIDQQSYNALQPGVFERSMATGQFSITTSRKIVSYYDYETDLNESYRNIKLLNSIYVGELEKQFKKLMA